MAGFLNTLDPDAVLGQLDPHPTWYNQTPPGNLMDPITGQEVYDTKGDIKKDFSSLPLQLPNKVNPIVREVLFKKHKHMTYLDIWARQPAGTPLPKVNALNMERLRKARTPYRSRCWSPKYTGRPTKVLVLLVETLTPPQIAKNTTWNVTAHGIVDPQDPTRVLPLDYFLINGVEHIPSVEVRDALAESRRLLALAQANGKRHWSELPKNMLPRAWSTHHKDGDAAAEIEPTITGRLDGRETGEDQLQGQVNTPVIQAKGKKRQLERQASEGEEEDKGLSKRAKHTTPEHSMTSALPLIMARGPQDAGGRMGNNDTSSYYAARDPRLAALASRGNHVDTNELFSPGQAQRKPSHYLKRKRSPDTGDQSEDRSKRVRGSGDVHNENVPCPSRPNGTQVLDDRVQHVRTFANNSIPTGEARTRHNEAFNDGGFYTTGADTVAFNAGAYGVALRNNNSRNNHFFNNRVSYAEARNAGSSQVRAQNGQAHIARASNARPAGRDIRSTYNHTARLGPPHTRPLSSQDTGFNTPSGNAYGTRQFELSQYSSGVQRNVLPYTPLETYNRPIVQSSEQDNVEDILGAGQHDSSGWNIDIFDDHPTNVTMPTGQGLFTNLIGNEASNIPSISAATPVLTAGSSTNQTDEQHTVAFSPAYVSNIPDALRWAFEDSGHPDTTVTTPAPVIETSDFHIQGQYNSDNLPQKTPDLVDNGIRNSGTSSPPTFMSTAPAPDINDFFNYDQAQFYPDDSSHNVLDLSGNLQDHHASGSGPTMTTSAVPTIDDLIYPTQVQYDQHFYPQTAHELSNDLVQEHDIFQPSTTTLSPQANQNLAAIDHTHESFDPENPLPDLDSFFPEGTTSAYEENVVATAPALTSQYPATFDTTQEPTFVDQSTQDFPVLFPTDSTQALASPEEPSQGISDHSTNNTPIINRTQTPPLSFEEMLDYINQLPPDEDAWWMGITHHSA